MTKKHNFSQRVFGRTNRRDIPLENDAMFAEVMRRKDACIGLLETIFEGRRIRDIVYEDDFYIEPQKNIIFDPGNKSIRLDVYFEDEEGVYDIELQKVKRWNLAKRSRMYSSMMDANMLDKGLEYDALKKSYVIFVCMFDVFGKGMKSYRFRTMCENVQDLPLDDGRYIIVVNTKGSAGDSTEDMDAFFRYLNGGIKSIGTGNDSGNEFVRKLDRYVLDINGDEDWRQGYMKYELNLIEKYKDGKAEGVNEGRAEGISIGRAEGEANATGRMVKGFKSLGLSDEDIAKGASISVEEVRNILKG